MAVWSTSSAASTDPHKSWTRWLLPSASDAIFLGQLAVLAFTNLAVRLLGDAGIGWHICTGQLILATRSIPRFDPFSSSMPGKPWFAWEWLYDVAAGWLQNAAGLDGVVLFTALTVAFVFALTFRLLLQRGTNFGVALVLVLLAECASAVHLLARPHVVSWLFTVLWFWILESSTRPGSRADFNSGFEGRRTRLLVLLPLSMLAWVNLHGGFLVGLVLLALYWISSAWHWLRLKEERFDDVLRKIRTERGLKALTLVGILSAAATWVNPYGFQLHVHIYRYLSNRFLMDHIDEFQSPNFHYVAQKCFAVLLLLALIALAAKPRAPIAGEADELSRHLLLLFAVYSGLYASRNIPVASLLLVLVIGPWLSDAASRFSLPAWPLDSIHFFQRMRTIELNQRGHLWPLAAVVLSCWIAAHGGRLGERRLMNAHFSPQRFPVAAVDYLQKHELPGPVLSPDSWGGYLIYQLYPRARVVIDDRHDFYGEQFLKSYLKTIHVEPGWDSFIREHQVGCIAVPKNSALANILLETSGWRAIYNDDVATIFVPSPTANE
jgi:hypothetical protein